MDSLLHSVAWSCLSHPSYHNPKFDVAFPTKDAFVSAFGSAGFLFCSGLLDVVHSAHPPSLAWFQSVSLNIFQDRDQVPSKSWGLYLHVFLKPGCEPLIYIGSATASDFGIRARFKDYQLLHAVSQQIIDAINNGYVLGHTVILGHCPIPQPADQPVIRGVCLSLETAFSAIFWCMRSKTTDYGHLEDHSGWNLEELPYGGLCTHSPLIEGIDSLNVSAEELNAIAEERRRHNNEYNRDWARANNAKQRANPTPEFAAQRTKINSSKYKNKKRKRDSAVANKTRYCDLCEKTYTSAKELEIHCQTPLHLRREARGEKDFSCAPCGVSYPNKTRYDRHCRSEKHKNPVEYHLAKVALSD
jgi:hypothetical protein